MRRKSLLIGLVVLASACAPSSPSTRGLSTTTTPVPPTTEVISPSTPATTLVPLSTTGEGTTSDPAGPEATPDLIVVGEPIQLGPRHFVVGVDQGDVLNGRFSPGVGSNINAEIDPAYGTVRVKGVEEESEDGGVWTSATYSPDTQLVFEPFAGPAYGWVNSAFLAHITGWLPPGGACDLTLGIGDLAGDSASTADEIYDVIAIDLGECVRIVVTFAENASGDHLGVVLPPIGAAAIDQRRLRISTPVDIVLPHATDIFAEDYAGLVVSRPGDGLWMDFALPGAASVRGIAETGQLLIDLAKGDVSEIFVRDGTIVALPPIQMPSSSIFVGYARPFEATMSVLVGEWQGDAVFPESISGPSVILDGAALMTTGWLDAWGLYQFRVEGLRSGQYQVIVADDTAVEEGFSVVRFPIAVP
jgi:hypothetical protein